MRTTILRFYSIDIEEFFSSKISYHSRIRHSYFSSERITSSTGVLVEAGASLQRPLSSNSMSAPCNNCSICPHRHMTSCRFHMGFPQKIRPILKNPSLLRDESEGKIIENIDLNFLQSCVFYGNPCSCKNGPFQRMSLQIVSFMFAQ